MKLVSIFARLAEKIVGIVDLPLLKVMCKPSGKRIPLIAGRQRLRLALPILDLKREKKQVAIRPTIITLGDVVLSYQGPLKLGPILSRRFGRP